MFIKQKLKLHPKPYTLDAVSGFTLIELLMSIAVIIILGTLSSVYFSRFLTQNAVSNVQDQMVGQIRKSQMYAMMGRQNGNWGVEFGTNKITLYQGTSFALRNSALDETFSVNPSISMTFSQVNFSKTTGLPNATGTFTISGNGISKTFSINAQGTVSR